MFGSLLVSGMMRKGLFIFIIAGKVACYCKHVSVKITDDDVIRKDGGRREMRWENGDEMGECTWAVEMETCGESGRQERWWCCRKWEV